MIESRWRMTKLTWLLLGLMSIEIGLVIALRKLGWFGTGNLLQMLGSILVIALPLLIIGIVFLLNRFRLSLRMVLISVALISLFMALSVKPLLDYRESRRGGFMLLEAGATVDTEQYRYLQRVKWKHQNKTPTIEEPVIWVPPWISFFVRDIQQGPADVTVVEILVESDEQLKLLAENANRFPNLKKITLNTIELSSEGTKHLSSVFAECESLASVSVWGENPNCLQGELAKCDGLRGVSFGPGLPPSIDLVDELTSLENLEEMAFTFESLDDVLFKSISPGPKLKKIRLFNTKVSGAAVKDFGKAYPTCELEIIRK